METKDFCLTGVIEGKPKGTKTGIIENKPKDTKLLQEYMISTINSIKNEINQITNKYKNIYIYYRYNSEKILFTIFVVINNNKIYYKNNEITYSIIVKEEYPQKPPDVFCLTDFYEKLDIFDMRNIQKNLVHDWKQNNNINDLIKELLTFSDLLIYQAEKKLFPRIGEYHFSPYVYDLNEFLLNKNNLFFRTYFLNNKGELNNNEIYMIINKSTILFLSSHDQKLKNHCKLIYKFELTWLQSLKHFSLQKYPNYMP